MGQKNNQRFRDSIQSVNGFINGITEKTWRIIFIVFLVIANGLTVLRLVTHIIASGKEWFSDKLLEIETSSVLFFLSLAALLLAGFALLQMMNRHEDDESKLLPCYKWAFIVGSVVSIATLVLALLPEKSKYHTMGRLLRSTRDLMGSLTVILLVICLISTVFRMSDLADDYRIYYFILVGTGLMIFLVGLAVMILVGFLVIRILCVFFGGSSSEGTISASAEKASGSQWETELRKRRKQEDEEYQRQKDMEEAHVREIRNSKPGTKVEAIEDHYTYYYVCRKGDRGTIENIPTLGEPEVIFPTRSKDRVRVPSSKLRIIK